jgi:hypothetical protein
MDKPVATVTSTIRELMIDALPIIEKAAPYLASLFHGRSEFIIGFILPLIARVFDVQPSDLNGLVQAITTHPDADVKLKKIEDEHLTPLTQFVDIIKTLNKVVNTGE